MRRSMMRMYMLLLMCTKENNDTFGWMFEMEQKILTLEEMIFLKHLPNRTLYRRFILSYW